MRARLIYEKFTEDSDPIRDMGIGMISKIEKWLKEMNIKNYTINKNLTIDASGFIDLNRKLLDTHKLPKYIQFNIIKGCFWISYNDLTTLRGCLKKFWREIAIMVVLDVLIIN